MSKIKISYIITKLELGGAQKTTLSLIRLLSNEHYEVHLITSPKGYLIEEARQIPGLKIYFISSLARQVDIVKDLTAFFDMIRYLRQQGISIVHTHSSKAGIIGRWAARTAGVRHIFHTVHGWPFYIKANPIIRFFYRIAEKLTCRITDRVIVVSNADLKAGLRYVDNRKEKYARISYGIESARFFAIARSFDKEGIIKVGFIACYKHQKAPFDFIRVAEYVLRENKNIKFISAGDGILRPAVMQKAASLGLLENIEFLGWHDDIAGLMPQIDILILTSLWEGLPVVVLEALASGIPVVTTDTGGVSELVFTGINGFVEKKGDCKNMAKDILLLAEDNEKRAQLSSNAKRTLREEFDVHYMSKRTQNLYEKIEKGLHI
jgi:glycosyltransferase involved in cell wall biosynthesis